MTFNPLALQCHHPYLRSHRPITLLSPSYLRSRRLGSSIVTILSGLCHHPISPPAVDGTTIVTILHIPMSPSYKSIFSVLIQSHLSDAIWTLLTLSTPLKCQWRAEVAGVCQWSSYRLSLDVPLSCSLGKVKLRR